MYYQKEQNVMRKPTIPIFFACDDAYIPFLAVALASLEKNASRNYHYAIKILYVNNISEANRAKIIAKYQVADFAIEFVDITATVKQFNDKFHVRDYYSKATYYRLFIPKLYPQYKKALYLDSDIVVLGDVSRLYHTPLGRNLVGAITDEAVQNFADLCAYVEQRIGVKTSQHYFNAGILLMNLKRLREIDLEKVFLGLVDHMTFEVAQDQDYLNVICRNQVKYIDNRWDKMPFPNPRVKEKDIKLLHFNLDQKPWQKEGILYEKYFWEYARQTEFYDTILAHRKNYTAEQVAAAQAQTVNLVAKAKAQAEDTAENQRIARIIKEVCQHYKEN